MLSSSFDEAVHTAHVAKRSRMLSQTFPFPDEWQHTYSGYDDLIANCNSILDETGVALFRGGGTLSDDLFVEFGRTLGRPIKEHAPSAQSFTSMEVILNVMSKYGHDATVSDQPFSTHHIRLHTECSRRPAHQQPKYLVFMCAEPGSNSTKAQTIVVPMDTVARRLSELTQSCLEKLHYAAQADLPPLLRQEEAAPTFSFRDFGSEILDWQSSSRELPVDSAQGNEAISELLLSLYNGEDWAGVTWQKGDILVLDNTRYFHGRADAGSQATGAKRLLKRLRVSIDER